MKHASLFGPLVSHEENEMTCEKIPEAVFTTLHFLLNL
jgi:hypothetical protein